MEGTDPMPSIYDALVYLPARLAVKLLWMAAGCPTYSLSCDKSDSAPPKPGDILTVFGLLLEAKIELRYDLLGPASRQRSGCWIIYGRKR